MTLWTPGAALYDAVLPATAPATIGPINVAGYDNLTAQLVSDGTNVVSVTFSWGTRAALDGTGPGQIITAPAIASSKAVPFLVRIRNLGPYMRINFSGAAIATKPQLALWGSNRSMDGDGPFTPADSGFTLLAFKSNNLATFATQVSAFTPYTGPATLYLRGAAGGAAQCWITDTTTGLEIGGTSCAANANSTVDVQIPATPCTLAVQNLAAAAQQVTTALVCR